MNNDRYSTFSKIYVDSEKYKYVIDIINKNNGIYVNRRTNSVSYYDKQNDSIIHICFDIEGVVGIEFKDWSEKIYDEIKWYKDKKKRIEKRIEEEKQHLDQLLKEYFG